MLIIKLTISMAIILLTGYIGVLKAKDLKNREHILREMITFLGMVKNEMKYMLTILPNAYEISRLKLTTSLKDVMGNIVVDMLENDGSYLINQSIVENVSSMKELTDYDKNVYISILKNLGMSDIEGQMNIIENGIGILENQIKEANEKKLTNTKMYRVVGVISGLMLVVVFI